VADEALEKTKNNVLQKLQLQNTVISDLTALRNSLKMPIKNDNATSDPVMQSLPRPQK